MDLEVNICSLPRWLVVNRPSNINSKKLYAFSVYPVKDLMKGLTMAEDCLDKVLGCIFGATVGDSVGGPVEFKPPDFIHSLLNGEEWLEDMLPYRQGAHPLGIWVANAPRGTGTDDTRLNHIFIESVIKNRGHISAELLALEYIYRYRNHETIYPKKYWSLAKEFLENPYICSCALLGFDDPEIYRGLPPHVAKNPPGLPNLMGLISLQSVGLLYPNDTQKAYAKAYELSSIMDIGFAHDATALLAATVSAAMSEEKKVEKIIERALKTNPFGFRNRRMTDASLSGHDFIDICFHTPTLPKFFEIVEKSRSERELILGLAKEGEYLHPFDPFDCLGVALAAIQYHKGDPVRSILAAANHRRVDGDGKLIRLRDVDCIAGVAGAIVGAINGLSAFPKDWVRDVAQANRDVYDIDIEKNARRFYDIVY